MLHLGQWDLGWTGPGLTPLDTFAFDFDAALAFLRRLKLGTTPEEKCPAPRLRAACVAAMAIFGFLPALGLRTLGTPNVFSSLRLDGGGSNHLIIPASWASYGPTAAMVRVESTSSRRIGNHVLEHIADFYGAVANWLRVTRLGGLVLFVLPDPCDLSWNVGESLRLAARPRCVSRTAVAGRSQAASNAR